MVGQRSEGVQERATIGWIRASACVGKLLFQKQTWVGWGRNKERQQEQATTVTFPEPRRHTGARKQVSHMEGNAVSVDVSTSSSTYSDGGLVVPVSTAHSPGRGTEKWAGQSRIQKYCRQSHGPL